MRKTILWIVGILLALIVLLGVFATWKMNNFLYAKKPLYLTFTIDTSDIEFMWAEKEYDNFLEPNNAMIIPTKLQGLSNSFYFQFDTGAPTSMVYGKPLQALQAHSDEFLSVEKGKRTFLKQLSVDLGGAAFDAKMIKILEGFGKEVDLADTSKAIMLGTIGSDIFDKRCGMINFQDAYIKVYPERPEWMAGLPAFLPFNFKGRRFIFPAEIEGKKIQVFYDSGSSPFGLWTSKRRARKFAKEGAEEIALDGNSWGNTIAIRHLPSDKMISIGGTELELRRASYLDKYSSAQRFLAPLSKIDGLLGNKALVESKLIFDCIKEEFLVLDEGGNNP